MKASQVLRWPGLSTSGNGPSPHPHFQVVLRHSDGMCSAMSLAGRASPQEGQRTLRSGHSVAWEEGHDKVESNSIFSPDSCAKRSGKRNFQSILGHGGLHLCFRGRNKNELYLSFVDRVVGRLAEASR